jgi:amidase
VKPIHASATELVRRIRAREVSSLELVDAHLARIEAVDPLLHAVVTTCADAARARARQADAALARGERWGALHGLPITLKDSIDTAGVRSTWGTAGRAAFVPDEDATVAARLRGAGAILLGKTATPELTMGYETESLVHGRTSNPWDLARTPGGSSGGAAAIVAAGGSPLDVGSDTGGSIRVPAHFCGVAGIRPTSGRVPRTGHAIGPGGLLDPLTTLGPIARTVDDLALALPLLCGPDGRDPALAPVPLGDPRAVRLAGLRVAFFVDNGLQSPTPEIAEAVRRAAKALAAAGCELEEVRPPGIEETLEIFGALMVADGGAALARILEKAGTGRDETTLGYFLDGPGLGAAQLAALLDRWDRLRSGLLAFVEDRDVLLSPPCAIPACRHGGVGEALAAFSYTMTWNLTGWPAAAVPAGVSPEGLPVGVQVVAKPWRDDVALAAARAIEVALGSDARPGLP